MMLKNMKFGTKLLVAFLVVGIIPAAVIGVISLNQTSKALSKAAFEKLEAVQRLKNTGVESFIKYVNRDINDLSHRKSLHKLYDELKKYHDERGFTATSAFDVSAPAYKAIYDNHIGYFKKLMEERGYYDIFLICAAHGHVMCTVARESDLGENLGTGPLKDSGLARLWRNVVKKKGICFEDFSPYAPSNNEPAAFMGEPIFDENERIIGVVAIQVSIDKINELMHNRTGMGKTGEIYLVGTDKLMRSDSYLDPVNHTVKASFANPSKGSVDTEASREALAGNKGKKIIIDYNG
ncbi:MAG: cache domain-containing protein, partial [Desulfobulbaceae bacterium]|nr:cache domain-containing protein [Desulfobulbaceae bacterium]